MYDFTKTRGSKELYEIIVQNAQRIGGKFFLNVPLQLVYVDPEYQRVDSRSEAKVKQLAANWDDNKCDPIRLVAHPEEYKFACVDGLGRIMAKSIRASLEEERFSTLTIESEVIFDAPTDPTQRKVFEANLFATQCDQVEALRHYQKHNANILRGVRENVILQAACMAYGISVAPHGRGRVRGGNLGDFTGALDMCKLTNGDAIIRNVFEVIARAGWHNSTSGYSKYVIQSLKRLFLRHAGQEDIIINMFGEELVNMEPLQLKAYSISRYPDRETVTSVALYLEDMIVEKLDLPRVYFAEVPTVAISSENS